MRLAAGTGYFQKEAICAAAEPSAEPRVRGSEGERRVGKARPASPGTDRKPTGDQPPQRLLTRQLPSWEVSGYQTLSDLGIHL